MKQNTDVITHQELRKFGLLVGFVLFLGFGVILPTLVSAGSWKMWPFIGSWLLISLGIGKPESLRLFHKYWLVFGEFLGSINTKIILGFTYIGIFVPMGLAVKIFKKDLLKLKGDTKVKTYKNLVDKELERTNSLKNPF